MGIRGKEVRVCGVPLIEGGADATPIHIKRRAMSVVDIPPVRDAISEYTKFNYSNMGSDYSVTDLIKPPRITLLSKRYSNILPESNPDDVISSFIGSAIHAYFERWLWRYQNRHIDKHNYLVERRLWDKFLGRKISGQFDVWLDGILYDFKCTTVWKAIFGDQIDWERQLNLYAMLLSLLNPPIPVNGLRTIVLYRDWQRFQTRGNPEYPKEQIIMYEKKLWDPGDQYTYLIERLQTLVDNEDTPDWDLPECTPEDMWSKDTVYAVYAEGDEAKAKRLMPTKEKAQEWITKNWRKVKVKGEPAKSKSIFYIEKRPGERTRCEGYCNVRQWCTQWQDYQDEKAKDGDHNSES